MDSRQPGQILGGKYRLIRPLGKGGMGSVWLAQHLGLNAPVALKFVLGDDFDDAALQRFLAEARIAAALRSPHVVQILDYGVDAGIPHIAMEVLEGETLADRLARVGRLSSPETLRVIQQVVRAIARAHDAGVVHRDLKPENIFIVRNDDDELIKVLDFGIAKGSASTLGTSVAAATRTGAFLGTPHYMSPEQIDEARSTDFRTDIWSLGVLAFRCLLGQLPFPGDSVGRVLLAICSRPLPVPSEIGAVPPGFDAWFARACAREPKQRFGSARQAASELLASSADSAADGSGTLPNSDRAAAPPESAARADPFPTTVGELASAEVPRVSTGRRSSRHIGPVALVLGLLAVAVINWFARRGGPPDAPALVPTTATLSERGLSPPVSPPQATQTPPTLPAASPSPSPGASNVASTRKKPSLPRAIEPQRKTRSPTRHRLGNGTRDAPERIPETPPANLDLGI